MRLAYRVWQRDFIVWTKYCWGSLISNLGEPIFYILAMGFGLGKFVGDMEGVPYLVFLAPAILASSVMNSASFETTFSSYTRLSVQKTFDGIMVTPVSAREVVAGEIFWATTKSLMTGATMLIILMLFGLVKEPVFSLWILPLVVLTGILFASLGMLVTSFAKSYDFFAYYFTLILGPMFFFSGTFFPLSQLPSWAQGVAWVLPLTHCVRLNRALILGHFQADFCMDIAWLILVTILIFWLAVTRMERRMVI